MWLTYLGLLAIGLLAFAGGLWFGRREPVNPDQVDVDELALEVGRLKKLVRREHMSRVRAGEGSPEDPSLAAAPPPELKVDGLSPLGTPISKEELRRRIFQVRR